MKEQNSYAYIGNSKTKVVEKEGKKTFILSGVLPKQCIKGIFEEDKIQILESELTKLIFTTEVSIESDFFEVMVTINNVKHSFYVDIEVEGKTKAKTIKCLEYIHEKLEESDLNTKDDYIQVITYDSISEYYCDKIYPILSRFERSLRHLLLNIYLVYFEQDYYLHQFDENIEEKIKSGVQARGGSRQKEITRIKEAFYSLDFKTIEDMLFIDKFTKYEVKKIEKTLSKVDDLSALSDSELRSLIGSFLPKSDWNRFFADKINGADFKEIFKRIRNNRNKVAHQKFFYKKDYLELKKDLDTFTRAIDKAIEITRDEEFSRQNREYMKEAFEGVKDILKPSLERIGKMASAFSEAMANSMVSIRPLTKAITEAMYNLGNTILAANSNLGSLPNEDESSAEDDGEPESDDGDIE